jgi:8-oxo-dGTP pyrophosphatase MutT (NUDIX family)
MTQDTSWRPPAHIRVKVIALARRDDALLVCEVLDDDGARTGWCPLGGGVEFGETTAAALRREIREELGCDIRIDGAPTVCENLYGHYGEIGHEIVFAYPVTLSNPDLYRLSCFQIAESDGSLHAVEWVAVERFRSGAETFFPDQLAPVLFPA